MKRFAAVAVVAALAAGAATAQPAAGGKRYAVLVGVGEYDHPSLTPLKYAERDAQELARVLRERGYRVDLLSPKAGAQQPQLQPTLANIRGRLEAVLAECRKDDIVLVGLAGHGLQFEGEKDSYFCPSGAKPFPEQRATLLSVRQVYDELKQSNAGAKLMLVDACRNDPASSRGVDADAAPRPPRGVATLFSCAAGQRAYELDKYKHGVFFHHVIEGLKGAARDADNDVTWHSLSGYVRKRVTSDVKVLVGRGARQEPHGIDDLTGDSPVLVNVGPPTRVALKPATPADPVPRQVPARRVPAELCLPDDTKLVAHLNVHQMAGSPVLRPVVLEVTESFASLPQKSAQLDLMKDTRTFYFALYDMTGRTVVVLQGSYEQATFQEAFGGNPQNERVAVPGTLLAYRDKQSKAVTALLDSDMIVEAPDVGRLRDVAAKRVGEREARYPPALREVMAKINRAKSITIGFPDRTMWATDAAEKQFQGVKRVGAFRLSAHFTDAIYVDGAAGLSNTQDARAFAGTLLAERAKRQAEFAGQTTPEAVFFTAFLKTVQVETAGRTLSGVMVRSVVTAEQARPAIDGFVQGWRVGFKKGQDAVGAKAKQ